ncbi:DUF1365 domain-containing protein [Rivibacter subsaxonicus]|uniref:DUF1365 family protein n=1 Tax=Rivibacter subsaxonicus TaxID=457575 RepID=A0A4Q7VW31_9BURK|nr:DUF1365 domain-containing protein [Rivibacter subsaxonicus]RZU00648.1 hypothetical protein EV670_1359 [Rivibacter subsaxonicus]
MNSAAVPLIGFGSVRHARLRPVANAFAYRSYFLLLPMRTLRSTPPAALPRNRFAPLSFDDRDHGDGGPDALVWLERLLASEGVDDADGEIWLQCYPRVFGYAFKPVSFWFAHRADASLAAVVVEVNNTFGERHVYLLQRPGMRWGQEFEARKVFHVSPFCAVEGRYRFRFLRTGSHPDAAGPRSDSPMAPHRSTPDGERIVVRIDHDDADGPLLQTSLSGRLEPLTAASARRALLGMPLMTLGVVARIHWQALRLWRKRVPFLRKPQPPSTLVTR